MSEKWMIIAVVTLTVCSGNIAPEGKKTYKFPQATMRTTASLPFDSLNLLRRLPLPAQYSLYFGIPSLGQARYEKIEPIFIGEGIGGFLTPDSLKILQFSAISWCKWRISDTLFIFFFRCGTTGVDECRGFTET